MAAISDSVLSIHNLHKRYGKNPVLHGVELNVAAASIHGLVGLNGAGKTTTLECSLGLQHFDSGRITIVGVEPAQLHCTSGKLAAVFDAPCIPVQLTVRQVLEYARLLCGARADDPARLEERLGIARYRDYKINQLSLGNRRRAAIAQALIGRPELLILDEPFNGLDAGGVDDVLALIKELNREQGTTLLLASHQLSYLERICSHMAFLHQGRMAVSDSMDALLARHRSQILLRTEQAEAATDILGQMNGVHLARLQPEGDSKLPTVAVELDGISAAEVNRELVDAGIPVHELIQQNAGLEALFRQVTESAV